ncbi:MAG TPA: lysozyme inhibitor LprI family protein [Paracoccaceae bacterium]|nr:lysozyme inhibitor LprI family protein [Paracoccaceae bacterium]
MRARVAAAVLAAVLAQPSTAQPVDCANPITQTEMTACAEREWMTADADLNAAYAEARAAMRRIDAPLPETDRGAERMLRDAQRAWIDFRDKTCAAEGWAMKGGSAEPMLVYFCRARVTAARAEELRAMAFEY